MPDLSLLGRITAKVHAFRLTNSHFGWPIRNYPKLTDFEVAYKDEEYIVINKRPFVRVYNVDKNDNSPKARVTVASQFCHRFPQLISANLTHGVRFVHRLDYATSGALLLALTSRAQAKASNVFQKRQVTKHYLALVRGHVLESSKLQIINISIGINNARKSGQYGSRCIGDTPGCSGVEQAVTLYTVLEHGLYDNQPASKLLLIPVTGRTHQLRVHLKHKGHHIIGDYMYSDHTEISPPRLMLHAWRLGIPLHNKIIDVSTTDPFTNQHDPRWVPTNRCRLGYDGSES